MLNLLAHFKQTVTAGTPWRQPVSGRQFLLFSTATGISVTFYDKDHQLIGKADGMQSGQTGQFPVVIGMVEISVATTQTVEFFISDGGFDLGILTGTIQTVPKAMSALSQNAAVTVNATTCVSVLAANANAKQVFVSIPETHTGRVWLRGSNAASAQGIPLSPGGVAILEFSGQLFCYNPEAGSVAVSVAWLE